MGDEEDGRGAVTDTNKYGLAAILSAIGTVAFFMLALHGPSSDRNEFQTTRQKWGAEADALDLILRERQEPQGGITCYRRAGRYECPLHLAGQPTRWAACRMRREDERSDDGGRCAWVVDAQR